MIFDIDNWLWKSNFGTFWQLAINPTLKTQNSIISFWYVNSHAKIFLILYPPAWKLHNPYCHKLHPGCFMVDVLPTYLEMNAYKIVTYQINLPFRMFCRPSTPFLPRYIWIRWCSSWPVLWLMCPVGTGKTRTTTSIRTTSSWSTFRICWNN